MSQRVATYEEAPVTQVCSFYNVDTPFQCSDEAVAWVVESYEDGTETAGDLCKGHRARVLVWED